MIAADNERDLMTGFLDKCFDIVAVDMSGLFNMSAIKRRMIPDVYDGHHPGCD